MHKDEGLKDGFELICSIPDLRVRRYRMRSTRELKGLETGQTESLLVPLSGRAEVTISGREDSISLREKDMCYLPSGTTFTVRTGEPTDLIWAQAPAEKTYPAYVRRFSEMTVIESGTAPYSRRVIPTIREQDPANRFLAGFVEGEQGNWTSFPPHKHDGKPEVYIYFGMGKRFGVQVIGGVDEKAFVVREGDAVAFERGYHANVATPGVGMSFLWIISADPKARDMSVDFHPDYKDLPIGKTHLSTR
ncbi:MAG: 5-deoxy-glucuronate isomerase [Thaumarchaeota archaeon]|nr:5-deoxy-glucuronate isomerase [Nitrososphaerota archaeon]